MFTYISILQYKQIANFCLHKNCKLQKRSSCNYLFFEISALKLLFSIWVSLLRPSDSLESDSDPSTVEHLSTAVDNHCLWNCVTKPVFQPIRLLSFSQLASLPNQHHTVACTINMVRALTSLSTIKRAVFQQKALRNHVTWLVA